MDIRESGVFDSSVFCGSKSGFSCENDVDVTQPFIKVVESIKKLWNLDDSQAHAMALEFYSRRSKIPAGQAVPLQGIENLPCPVVATGERIHFLIKEIGVGATSKVYQSQVLALSRHQVDGEVFSPSKPKAYAVKKSKQPLSPQKRELDSSRADRQRGLDLFLDTFKENNREKNRGYGYSLHHLYQSDLTHANFHKQKDPVQKIMQTLISCTEGLAALHLSNAVHRDVKGANILVRNLFGEDSVEEDADGAVTDFGCLQKEKTDNHHTTGTPEYLDPSMFGSLEECVLLQKVREGRQTKEGDVFALGMTIYKDVLLRFIPEICSESDVSHEVVQLMMTIKPKFATGRFSDNELRKIGKESKFRIMHRYVQGKDLLIRYPDLPVLHETLQEACRKLQSILTEEETYALARLAHLACQMQVIGKERPEIHKVLVEMKDILQQLGARSPSTTLDDTPNEELSPSAKKRRLEFDDRLELNEEPFFSSIEGLSKPHTATLIDAATLIDD
jgi:serine/threonine protein kinase